MLQRTVINMIRCYASNISNMVNGCTDSVEVFRNNNKEKIGLHKKVF